MNSRLLAKAKMRTFSLVLLFAVCQIVGIMCTVPDLSMATDKAQLAVEMNHMTCQMDGTIMCPPSAVSSPERQLKHSLAVDLTQTPVLLGPAAALTVFPIWVPWCWSAALELVPISIASSSVLRI